MENVLLNNSIVDLWKDAAESKNLFDYVVAIWVTLLFAVFAFSWVTFTVNFIMNPSMLDTVTFGIFDYI